MRLPGNDWENADIAPLVRGSSLLIVRFLPRLLAKELRGDLIGLDSSGNATIHRNQEQQVLHLLPRATVGQRALGVDAKFGRPVAGRRDREHYEAALGIGQAGALPDVAIDIGVDDVL